MLHFSLNVLQLSYPRRSRELLDRILDLELVQKHLGSIGDGAGLFVHDVVQGARQRVDVQPHFKHNHRALDTHVDALHHDERPKEDLHLVRVEADGPDVGSLVNDALPDNDDVARLALTRELGILLGHRAVCGKRLRSLLKKGLVEQVLHSDAPARQAPVNCPLGAHSRYFQNA